ncbi:MAG: CPBP family intramembrane metalloprotease [Spirochaetes bacterium]|nr:CPBP family intramembrane metalloprotease [Spirochaetota bacterium]
MKAFIKDNAIIVYFILTFFISWAGVLLVVGIDRLFIFGPSEEQMGLLFLAMCAGPSISGILLTYICDGREGLSDLKNRLLKWKVSIRWYAVAFLTAPVLILSILLVLSIFKSSFMPAIFSSDNKASLIIFGITGGLAAGIFEEIGWTGFVIPRMRLHYGIIKSGLIVGLLWGLWHLLLFMPGDPSGEVPAVIYFLIILFSQLPAYRVLMVWLYDNTTSLFATILMHTSLTFCALCLQSASNSGIDFVIYDLVLAVVLWIIIGFITKTKSLQNI